MAFPYDVDATNQALGKMGSTYRVPSYAESMNSTPPAAPAPAAPPPERASFATQAPAPVPQARDTESAAASPAPAASGSTMQSIGGWANDASEITPPEKQEGLKKLGNLVGIVGGLFTGNYAATANGAAAQQGK